MRIVWLSLLVAVGLASYRAAHVGDSRQVFVSPSDSIVVNPLPKRLPPKVLDSIAIRHITHLDSIYSSTPLYFKEDGHYYFYVANGKWTKHFATDTTLDFLLGIVDENYDTVLPPVYHKLYTPNGTAKGYIEIERDGKRGLLNYRTRQVTPATYDVIFPSHADGVVAIGRRGNQYYNLLPYGTEQLIPDRAMYPYYLNMLDDLAFDIKDHPYLNVVLRFPNNQKTNVYRYYLPFGALLPPSYLIETGFVREWIEGVGEKADFPLFTTDAAQGKIEQTKTTPWGFSILAYNFYEYGVDGRSRYNDTFMLFATIDTNNNILSKTLPYLILSSLAYLDTCNNLPYQFIGDTLLEVRYIAYHKTLSETDLPYRLMTDRKYFEITEKGEIRPLQCNRAFPYTKYVHITEDYFKGHYEVLRTTDNSIKWPNDENKRKRFIPAILYVADHLTADDLDLMYHEILADYGYKFKSTKWDAYFKQKAWYIPCFDNVDHLLNDYEKANLKLIKSTRDKVAKTPKKYINWQFSIYNFHRY